MKLFFKKLIAYLKIFIPFTSVTIKNIKALIMEIKEQDYKSKKHK